MSSSEVVATAVALAIQVLKLCSGTEVLATSWIFDQSSAAVSSKAAPARVRTLVLGSSAQARDGRVQGHQRMRARRGREAVEGLPFWTGAEAIQAMWKSQTGLDVPGFWHGFPCAFGGVR
jgi:hypothetical protein